MDRRLTLPTFTRAPEEYSATYLNDLVRMLNQAMTALNSPGEGRQSTLVLTSLPQNDFGLEVGGLYRTGRNIFVVTLDTAVLQGVSATGRVGTVTVTTV